MRLATIWWILVGLAVPVTVKGYYVGEKLMASVAVVVIIFAIKNALSVRPDQKFTLDNLIDLVKQPK